VILYAYERLGKKGGQTMYEIRVNPEKIRLVISENDLSKTQSGAVSAQLTIPTEATIRQPES